MGEKLAPVLYEALKALVDFNEPVRGWKWGYTSYSVKLIELGLVRRDVSGDYYLPTPQGETLIRESLTAIQPAPPPAPVTADAPAGGEDLEIIYTPEPSIRPMTIGEYLERNPEIVDEAVHTELAALKAEVERLRAALLPFAERSTRTNVACYADSGEEFIINAQAWQRAAQALGKE